MKKPASHHKPQTGLKPGQDFFNANTKASRSFPAVGVTLNSYGNAEIGPKAAPIPGPKKRGRLKRIFRPKRMALFLFLLILAVGLFLGSSFLYNLHKLFGGSIFDIFHSHTLKGESTGRINILLAGNSADDPGHDGANLTDSIMLVSIDTKDKTGFLLSIPRDLWVSIPGAGSMKINAAYVIGQQNNFSAQGYPNGGMGQLEQVVSSDFNIPIDYYALIDYTAIKDAVNAVGGINVNIASSDPRGLYDPSIDYATNRALVHLTNGVHKLDGVQALDLARARGDAYGSYGFADADFTRTQNQRKMLIALAQQGTSAGVLANPLKLNSLFNSIGSNVKTDLNLSDVTTLYSLTKGINPNTIQSLSLQPVGKPSYLKSYVVSGQDSLIPAAGITDFSQIDQYIQSLISNNPVVKEAAPVAILNGTSDIGLAGRVQSTLASRGLNITQVGDSTTMPTTEIVDTSGGKYPNTKTYLESLYGNNVVTTSTYSSIYPNNAFLVILGQDQAVKDPTYVH